MMKTNESWTSTKENGEEHDVINIDNSGDGDVGGGVDK
jgi:hypothetical protein